MPFVSVVVATYNRADYVPAAVESVLRQTFRDFELIVIDDGSTDHTARALERFDRQIRYQYQANSERAAARNHGLRLATGKYIAFLDSDDLWLPNKLEAELRRFRADPHLGLVYSDAQYIDAQGRQLGAMIQSVREGWVLPHILCDNFVPSGAHLLDREQFARAGAFTEDRRLSGSEDWEAWVRLAARVPFGHVRNRGFLYRLHDAGTVAHPQAMERAMLHAARLMFTNPDLAEEIVHLRARCHSYIHQVLASLYCSAGACNEARGHLRRALDGYPQAMLSRRYLGVTFRLLAGKRAMRHLRHVKRHALSGHPGEA
jgi:glycosyltransferase involved in cell wall biosynthesis